MINKTELADWTGPLVSGPIPGPQSAAFLARQEARESNARTYPRHLPIAIAEAAGSFVRDVDGNVFIDFLNGAGVLPFGHNHPELVRVAADQMLVETHGLDFPTPVKDAFIDTQLSMLPVDMQDRMKIHFCGPTGANAVEAAIKLCKTATGRGEVISFQGGFHGSTAAAMALTGLVAPKSHVQNGMPGVHFFPYSYCSQCPLGMSPATCSTNCATFLEHSLKDDLSGIPLPAAVILELVQGEGGSIPATIEFAQRVRAVTRELGIPLIVDEVQTGCGRTGTWFSFEQYGIEPDVIVASKALSGMGLPIALIMYDKAMDVWEPGAHIGTFRGNQLAFATGVEAVKIFQRDDILGNVRRRSEQCFGLLEPLQQHPWVREIRGKGLLVGVELIDPRTEMPAGDLAAEVQSEALNRGLILELGGRDSSVVRLLPPLNVTAEVMETACHILVDCIVRLASMLDVPAP